MNIESRLILVSHIVRFLLEVTFHFQKFAQKFLQWEEIYSFEKILPILTRWQCLNYNLIESNEKIKGILYPERIKKVRNPKGTFFFI